MADPISAGLTQLQWSSTAVSGPFTAIPHGRVIGFGPEKESKTYRSTSTAGAERTIGGTSDRFTGSITVYFDSASPFDTGSLGIVAGETGWVKVIDPASREYTFPVYVEGVDYEWDVEGDELIGATIRVRQNGNVVYPS